MGQRSGWIQGATRDATRGAVFYGLSLILFMWLIFAASGFVGNDDYYHARLADEMIEQKRLGLDFPWLPQTILSRDQFVDHHLLFHIVLAPWVHWGGINGAKIATAGIAAGVGAAMWALLRGVGVHYPALWTAALFGLSTPFLLRLLMVRTQGASLLLLIIALHLMFQQRYRWLLLVGFAYAWLYNGFVLLPILTACYLAAQWITGRKITWQPLVYSIAGVCLGLLINPYFPQNLAFISKHLGAKTDLENSVRVGSEWYPYTTEDLLINSPGALLALIFGLLWPSFSNRRTDTGADVVRTTLLLAALVTLYMVFRSRRFIEYFPAFALLTCAVSWGRSDTAFKPLLLVAGGLILLFGGRTLNETHHEIQNAQDVHYLAGASAWLEKNTPPRTLVFQTDWDDFPYLLYHNTHNRYLVGMDPTYLEEANPDLWNTWVAITQGRVHHPSRQIADSFGAQYVVSDTLHYPFAEQVRDDPGLRMVYRDEHSYVWEVLAAEPKSE